MNNFAAPTHSTKSAVSHAHAERSRRVELALYALCSGMTLLLAATTAVLTISQAG